jgi:hypothetical protein
VHALDFALPEPERDKARVAGTAAFPAKLSAFVPRFFADAVK